MKRTLLWAAAGIFYSLLLMAIALFAIHESALFLGVALAPFWLGPVIWPVAFALLGRRVRRGFVILVGLHYLGAVIALVLAKPYEWNADAAGLLLAKGTLYLLSQIAVWLIYAQGLEQPDRAEQPPRRRGAASL
jgi:hypothetical protein